MGKGLGLEISEETALRLPNAAFGALTVIPLFLLTTGLLGIRAGIITSLLLGTRFGCDLVQPYGEGRHAPGFLHALGILFVPSGQALARAGI